MTPRIQYRCASVIDYKTTREAAAPRFSRIPVYEDDIDDIVGVLTLRIFCVCQDDQQEISI